MRRPNFLLKKGGIGVLSSTVGNIVGALCKMEKGVDPQRYGKKESKASQVKFSRRQMDNVEFPGTLIGNVEFPGATEFPPKYESRRK